jgi:hypothetical protein
MLRSPIASINSALTPGSAERTLWRIAASTSARAAVRTLPRGFLLGAFAGRGLLGQQRVRNAPNWPRARSAATRTDSSGGRLDHGGRAVSVAAIVAGQQLDCGRRQLRQLMLVVTSGTGDIPHHDDRCALHRIIAFQGIDHHVDDVLISADGRARHAQAQRQRRCHQQKEHFDSQLILSSCNVAKTGQNTLGASQT